jgi:flavin-dependent dehydrogenase
VFDGRRVLAAGEAIGTTYAFTGEGIGQAMASGLAAAECVSEALERADFARLAGFEQQLRVSRKLHKGYQLAERWLSHSWLGDMLARLARRNQRLRLRLGGILGESVDPREVFSLRGLITAMVE